ncbi:hypothetical protein JCM10207_001271 [Rhodosporidiobolus poonsookiae]
MDANDTGAHPGDLQDHPATLAIASSSSGGLGVGDDKQAATTLAKASLCSLPDELLSDILEQLLSYDNNPHYLPNMAVNRRIWTLARQAWARKAGPLSSFGGIVYLARFPDLQPFVRDIFCDINSSDSDLVVFALLSGLHNLTRLRLNGNVPVAISPSFTRMLSELPNLVYLNLFNFDLDASFANTDFTLARNLPRLRHLVLTSFPPACTEQLFRDPFPTRQHIDIDGRSLNATTASTVEWNRLRTLTLTHHSLFPPEVLLNLRQSWESSLTRRDPSPLFSFAIFEGDPATEAATPNLLPAIASLVRLVAEQPVQELHIGFDQLAAIPTPRPIFKSVTQLVLYSEGKQFGDQPSLKQLLRLLTLFPNLVALDITSASFENLVEGDPLDSADAEADPHTPDTVAFSLRHTSLYPLLTFLRLSTVLSFSWYINDGHLCWARRTRDDDFHVDRIRRGWASCR